MSDENLPQVGGLTSIYPLVMLLSAIFTTGLVFTGMNVPLLVQALTGARDSSLVQVTTAAADFWRGTLPPALGWQWSSSICLACS